jgi:hypothetical protein
MTIMVDPTRTHGTSGVGNETVPPGIVGLDWCHICSDVDELELTAFLTLNLLTVACPATNVRTPLLGSSITYAGLDDTQRTAAVAAGATEVNKWVCISHAFDSNGQATYEP